jgi:hypothetical protein
MQSAYKAIDGTWVLPSCVPVPGMGVIPVNAYLIKARVPVLVDTGLHADTEAFVATLRTLIDLEDLRWIGSLTPTRTTSAACAGCWRKRRAPGSSPISSAPASWRWSRRCRPSACTC